MRAFQNISIGIAVVLVAMACMIFGDWVARGKRQPDYWYCQNAQRPERNEIGAAQEGTANDKKEARETTNQRYHELCSQWRAAESAEDAARVAWMQLWFGLIGLGGLLATMYFAGQSARAASNAATAVFSAERAYVKLSHEKPGIVFADDRHIKVRLEVKNHGGTPADVIGVNVTGRTMPPHEELPSPPPYAKNGRKRGQGFLVQADRYWVTITVRFKPGALAEVNPGTWSLYVFGYVDYRDRMTGLIHRGGWARAYTSANPENNLFFVDAPGYMYDRPRLASEDGDWDTPKPKNVQDHE